MRMLGRLMPEAVLPELRPRSQCAVAARRRAVDLLTSRSSAESVSHRASVASPTARLLRRRPRVRPRVRRRSAGASELLAGFRAGGGATRRARRPTGAGSRRASTTTLDTSSCGSDGAGRSAAQASPESTSATSSSTISGRTLGRRSTGSTSLVSGLAAEVSGAEDEFVLRLARGALEPRGDRGSSLGRPARARDRPVLRA